MKPVLHEKFNLSSWALNHQQMVSFFMLLIIAMGAFCYENLPRNEDPAFTIKTAVVSAQWPGASVTDTTRLLTDTLEKKLQETPWLDYLESETRAGSSVIHVNLRDDTPPQKVPDIWYQVRKKMQDIAPSLPEGVQGPAVDDEFDDTYGTIYGFIPEGYTLREVRDRVETIRRELMSLPDIGKTSLLGEQQEQIVLSFSPARLAGMGLNIQQVADALRAQNAVVPAGMIRTGQENMAIKVSGELTSEASLRAVTLHINDRYLPLTDIATVSRENAEPPQPVYRVNGKPAIGLAISMAPTGNILRFGAALNAKMQAISVTGIGATQLKHAFLQRRPRLGANRLAGADAAGDGHRRDAVVIDDLRNAVIGGVHPTEHAIRQAGGGKNLAQQAGAAHHVRGMLQQVAVAGQQDRHRAAQHLPDREVPRHDRQNGAQRTIRNHRLIIFHLRGFRRQHRRAVLGVPVAEVGRFRHLAARLSDRLAHLECNHLGHLFPAGAQRSPDATQGVGAVGERRLTPLAIACRGESDSRIDLAFAGPGQRGDHLTGSRVDGNRVRCR